MWTWIGLRTGAKLSEVGDVTCEYGCGWVGDGRLGHGSPLRYVQSRFCRTLAGLCDEETSVKVVVEEQSGKP